MTSMNFRILILVLMACTGCSRDRQLKRAQKLEKKGQFYQAWQTYQAFAAKHPKDSRAPEALFRAGWLVQRELKDCPMASVFYDGVVEKYPQSDPWGRLAAHQKVNCPDYFPLYPGYEWTEGDSESQGKNARIETVCRPAPDKGQFPSESGILSRTYYAGKQKFKTTELTYLKSAEGEIQEFLSENNIRSKTILKIPVEAGARWRTKDGERLYTYEVVAVDKVVKVAAGEFSSCVMVKSTVDGVPGATNEYYAPGVGRILTAFSTSQGERRNIELLSYKPAFDDEFKKSDSNP